MSGKWKKRYNSVKIKPRNGEPQTQAEEYTNGFIQGSSDVGSITSWLPQYYHGSADRMNRYKQYDYMDFDVDVNMALDKTAEFCTLLDETTNLPFILDLSPDVTTNDAKILSHSLKKWCRVNDWSGRLFELVRLVLKYGDQIFIRDPDTYILNFVDPYNVSRILVNEEMGKVPEYYFIRNIDFNLREKVATTDNGLFSTFGSGTAHVGGDSFGFGNEAYRNPYNLMSGESDEEFPVADMHIVHVSRSQGMDGLWPFGRSVLDPVFKPFRQKELMEEATIIYRVQRAPERLVFKIDTGDMNPKKASQYLEDVKKQFKSKRIPVVDRGSGETIMDTTYSPLSMMDDFYFAQGMDGRGSTVEQLPGGECLTLDTEIQLYNGEKTTLSDMITRYQSGEQMWIYSVDPVTEVVIPALVSWAGITRENTEVVELFFSDGTSQTVTPDHKFPIRGKGFVEAQNITLEDEFLFVDFDNKEKNMYFDKQEKAWRFIDDMFNEYHSHYPLKLEYRELFNDVAFDNTDGVKREFIRLKRLPVPVDNADTGTITVDGKEFYTDNHTFALGNGVFTKNSTNTIEDLKFFTTRMIRALRVPISYMSYLTEDGNTYTYNDGKNGTAYMEEFSYSEYCKRIQRQIIKALNFEFKLFTRWQGIEIDGGDFDIEFVPPQSFSEYRQLELDSAQLTVFQSVSDVSYLSKRFKMKRYLNMTDAEIKENERLWQEENKIFVKLDDTSLTDAGVSVPSVSEIDELEEDEFDILDNFNEGGEDIE